jgi:hypothetical protein
VARALVERHAFPEVEHAAAGLVHEHQAAVGVDDEDALVDQVDDGGQARGLTRHLPLEPRRLRDVVEDRQHPTGARGTRRQRHRVDETGERAPLDVQQQLGADDRLALGQRP